MDFVILHDELINDPLARGYAGMTDAQAAASLNTVNRQRERGVVPAHELIDATAPADWAALTSAEKQRYQTLTGAGEVNVQSANVRAAIIGGGGAHQLDALTASKRESLLWAVSDTLAPSTLAVRTALDDFCGSQNALKGAIQAAQKRTALRAEKLLSTGTGSVASPATMGFEGSLTYQDVEAALALQ